MYRTIIGFIFGVAVVLGFANEAVASTKKLRISPAAVFTAVNPSGVGVSCIDRGGWFSSGVSSTKGKGSKQKTYFTPAAGDLEKIAKAIKKARKKPAKQAELQAQYNALAAQINANDASCSFAAGVVPPAHLLPPAESLAPLARAVTAEDVAMLVDKAGYGQDITSSAVLQTSLSAGLGAGVQEFMRFKNENPYLAGFASDRLDEKRGVANLQNSLTYRGQRQAWLTRSLDTNNPFIYRLHECYLGIWTTSVNVLSERSSKTGVWESYAQMLYEAAQNDARLPDTVLNVSRHPMMLFFLSNNNNRRGSPNENFARELQELFTLGTHLIAPGSPLNGVPNYVEYRLDANGERVQAQGDIRRIARRLTGHRATEVTNDDGTKEWSWSYVERDHEPGPEWIYEGTPWAFPAESDVDIINGIFNKHPAAANYLATQLLKCFLTEKPAPNLVASLGAELKRNDWRVWPTLATLFRSQAFYAPEYRGTLTMNPYDVLIKEVRILGLSPNSRWDAANPANEYGVNVADLESRISNNIGFRLNQPDTVFWYPTDKFISPGTELNIANTIDRIISGYTAEQQRINWTIRTAFPQENVNSELAVYMVSPRINISLSADQLSTLRFYLDHSANSNGTYTAKGFETQSLGTRDSKLKTLVTLVSMLPANFVR